MAVTLSCSFPSDHSEWASPPVDFFFSVLDKLSERIDDHVRVASVCKHWRSLAKDYNHTTKRWYKIIPPILMLRTKSQEHSSTTSGRAELRGALYSVTEDKIYDNMQLSMPSFSSEDESCWCSCGHGWLAKVDYDDPVLDKEGPCRITLLNHFRKSVAIHLPPLDCICLHPNKKMKVILSADPALNPDNYKVMAFHIDQFSGIVFIKGGHEHWTLARYCTLNDALFHRGQFYAFEKCTDMIIEFQVRSWSGQRKINHRLRTCTRPMLQPSAREYLVELAKGDLVHVVRFLKPQQANARGNKLQRTESFKVYKMVFHKRNVEEVEVESIGDEALFVGDNQSVSVLASNFPGCRPNSIYYTDDLINMSQLSSSQIGGATCGDMRIFNLEDGTITQLYSQKSWDDHVPPTLWITPQFNGLC